MRILFVALLGSIHTARWLRQLEDTGWDIHVVDALDSNINTQLSNVTIHAGTYKQTLPTQRLRLLYRWPFPRGRYFLNRHYPTLWKKIMPDAVGRLSIVIKKLKPDIIHSMNMQHEAYFLSRVQRNLSNKRETPWIVSLWGSDIYWYQQFPEHKACIREVLQSCDYLATDCKRDIMLARENGFQGRLFGVFPGGGGYDIARMIRLRQNGPVSGRRVIAVKGYQHHVGRGIEALKALEMCHDQLQDYEIVVHTAHPPTEKEAERLAFRRNLKIAVFPRTSPEKIWELLGRSRISIGISESDGTPNTMLEAMIMGAFPIQTDPGGATSEWIDNGKNGFTVPHDDSCQIVEAIAKALEDDALVDSADALNQQLMLDRVEASKVKNQVLSQYRIIYDQWKTT